ncbi:unnamed protein product [Rhizophagus irregularis]|jgi:hypothetical protein|uniref:MATA-HMG n=1 Tax=Rhizophagus irregularis TaxID=588596 RepID=A0A1B1EUR4_9GLOM|nr:MATA-HMG [Rhizophagus irregularis]PKY51166.1 hypothetical protein RhiirA4_407184 [Rhizophagus irregularis]CAB4425635.1 unnamed protein product [Rhizophagus irregularis]
MSNKQAGDFDGDFTSVTLAQGFSTQLQQEIEDARLVKPQFPPNITSKDLIVHKKNGDMPSRSPNAFMIYRKLFVDELHNEGHYLPMTTASSMASSSWKNEPEFVKQEYRRLASEAKSRHLKLYSNQIPSRKRNKKIRNTQTQLASLQIIPQYNHLPQPRSEISTAVSSPITSSPEITEEISRVSHIPYGLSADNVPTSYYLPHVNAIDYNTRNNIPSGHPTGYGPFHDHSNTVLYDHLIPDYHQFSPYQQSSDPHQNFLPYHYFY